MSEVRGVAGQALGPREVHVLAGERVEGAADERRDLNREHHAPRHAGRRAHGGWPRACGRGERPRGVRRACADVGLGVAVALDMCKAVDLVEAGAV